MRKSFIVVVVFLAAIAAIASQGVVQLFATGFLYGITTASDAEECSDIVKLFLAKHNVPRNSISVPGHAPVFCNPGSSGVIFTNPPTVVIYNYIDRYQQDEFLKSLNEIRQSLNIKSIRVDFFERENWIGWKSEKASGGDRGPERQLRTETLNGN